MRPLLLGLLIACSAGCAAMGGNAPAPADEFFRRLSALCGRAYAGTLVAATEADRQRFGGEIVMHVRECSRDRIAIPVHVGHDSAHGGPDRSRTWVVTRTGSGLHLSHQHWSDGGEDHVTGYGGSSQADGSAARQEFPADGTSRAMFVANDLAVSVDNVWALEVEPARAFAYELRRPNRHFRIEFDLSRPVALPPPPWGAEP
jgi:hypothetical protein